jgi:hypothetical protein
MEDYRRNLEEFDFGFGSEAACREYLMQLRWPDAFAARAVGAREFAGKDGTVAVFLGEEFDPGELARLPTLAAQGERTACAAF